MRGTNFYESSFTSFIDPSESMTPIRRELISIRRSIVGKKHHSCVLRLGDVCEEIEPRIEI
jgi:hypothetical protein